MTGKDRAGFFYALAYSSTSSRPFHCPSPLLCPRGLQQKLRRETLSPPKLPAATLHFIQCLTTEAVDSSCPGKLRREPVEWLQEILKMLSLSTRWPAMGQISSRKSTDYP